MNYRSPPPSAPKTCPYCESHVEFVLEKERPLKMSEREHRFFVAGQAADNREAYYSCPHCERGVVVTRRAERTFVFPHPPNLYAPKHTPDKIAERYASGAMNLRSSRWVSAPADFRAVLEMTFPGPEGRKRPSADKRIERAKAEGRLPSPLDEMAKVVFITGNNSLHNHPIEREHVETAKNYTKEILRFVYTLPCMKSQSKESPPPSP